ncbi:acyl-CoA thioesterase [Herbiconiux liangxiaofengii]|uniref:acyl-CoA thioesterase n=1 Tax=Herbiconiux liangxiaofengii TaxID=3342795 RepID=UPI0035BA999F
MSTIASVHFFFRTLLGTLTARFRSPLGIWDVGTRPFRVLPTDLDVLRHMNNGVYLSMLDIARLDLLHRAGLWGQLQKRGWYPVVVAETISFRRSLELWQRFEVETRMLGFDERALYLEQRFVAVAGGRREVYARAFIRARLLKRSGGIVTVPELEALPGVGQAPDDGRMPEWLAGWGVDTQLPSTKAAAPSEW